jgi:hypothetical protein
MRFFFLLPQFSQQANKQTKKTPKNKKDPDHKNQYLRQR